MMVANRKPARMLWVALVALLVLAAAAPLGAARAQGPTSTPNPEFELVGLITAVAPGSFIVNGVTVITAGAELKVEPQVGIAVKVHGRLQPDQSIAAREVEAISAGDRGVRPGEAEFVGMMTSFIGGVMVVNGMTVDVAAAEIFGRLDPGGLVWVHATWDPARSVWIAREVGPFAPTREVRDDLARFDQEALEIIGTLTALTPEAITVAGLVIDIRNAEIDDDADLTLGALVKVEVRIVDGQLVATELDRTSQDRLRDSLMTRGRSGSGGFDDNENGNDNEDNGNDNRDDNGNGNDNNDDDHGNDNGGDDDHGNDNSRGNEDDHSNDNGNDD